MKTVSRRAALALLPASLLALAPAAGADQPHMHAALDALRVAERELEKASSDKGGYRSSALRHVRSAIADVQRGIKFDRQR